MREEPSTMSATNAESELALLAVEDDFVAEFRAGRNPQLATYLVRHPEHAEALTDYVAYFLAEVAPDLPDAAGEPLAQPLAPGALRALEAIFPQDAHTYSQAIAEARAEYSTNEPGDEMGLPALVRERGVPLDAVAAVLDVPLTALTALNAGALAPGQLARLAETLDVSQDEVVRRLAR